MFWLHFWVAAMMFQLYTVKGQAEFQRHGFNNTKDNCDLTIKCLHLTTSMIVQDDRIHQGNLKLLTVDIACKLYLGGLRFRI